MPKNLLTCVATAVIAAVIKYVSTIDKVEITQKKV